ncbi:MAG: DUF4011 domain-containing protein, partial [Planctomycetia bacterium]|nr:DUF4011 domain-containing protein [Planctomycetia bacterium]
MTDAHPNAVPDARIAIEVDADPCVNFALQQNRVPFVKRIRVTNCGAKTLEGVAVRVSMDPALADPICLRVDSIAPGSVVSFATVDFPLSSARLVQQTERESGVLRVEACLDDKVVSRELRPVEVLAYSEWPGTRSLPEILAAFVLPNHPIVQQILRAAAESLRSSTGDGALSGYQSRSRERVLAMARALYSAFSEMDIQYISPPASFESTGQKVRTPDQISTTRLGTCLDLTLLFAAALEQAGLHPILVLPRGHALVGVWLDDEAFPHPTVDDVTRIRKRVALGQIVTLETTLVTARPLPPFDEAVRAGSRHLEDGDKFHLAVDVRAARKALIRPLPARIDANARDLAPTPSIVHDLSSTGSEVERLVAVDPIAEEPDSPKKESGPARLERWKRRLLDLGLRNRLLNHRDTKTSIPLLCVSLAGLEDKLAGGSVFELHPEPEVLGPSDPRSAALFPTGAGHRASYLQTELDALRLHSSLGADELESRLTQLFRASRETLEEGGANTLFIALGFLRWFETKSSTQPRLAPLLLLPLQLERRTVVEGFRLKLADEDAQFNVTLLQKLAVDFGLNVTGLDALDEDDAGIDVAKILNRMRRAVLSLDRWEVVEEASIGLFSFTKYLMWRDLDKRTEKLLGHPVVRHLIETPGRPFAPETRFPDVERLDVERSPTSTFCPLDADSSQLRAIYAAADGATFVLEGPPGTGKSQTITNLIANAVAAGQRVLFVSEKMAALNVVHKRLSQVGLAPYCLELHSSKAQKRGVMAQLKAAVDSAAPGATTDWASAGAKLQTVRGELNAYADALHRRRSVGISAHEGIGRLMELRDAPVVDVAFGSLEAVDAGRLTTLREGAHSLQLAACDVEGLAASPWRGTGVQHWEPSLPERIRRIAEELVRAAGAVESASAEFATALGLPGDGLSARGVAQVAEIGRLLAASPGTPK